MRAIDQLEFVDFRNSLGGLEGCQVSMLVNGWCSLEALAKDADLERHHLLRCLCALRDSWKQLHGVSHD